MADPKLKGYPYAYESTRDVGDVLVGEDTARLPIEASSSGNDTVLQSLLSQPQWTQPMLEEPHRIYEEFLPGSRGPDDARKAMARPVSNLEWALELAAKNGHAAVASMLLAFAARQGIDASDLMTRLVVSKTIYGGHAAVLRVLASADPNVVNFHMHHGTLALYEAVRVRHTDVVAVLLEFGADPLRPVLPPRTVASYSSSLLSRAAMAEGPRMTALLLEHGVPIAQTGALHAAARCGHLETMRLLLQHGADVDETLANWSDWTPMHFAASRGRVDAIKLLEQAGARSDLEDKNGKTAAQLLEEFNIGQGG